VLENKAVSLHGIITQKTTQIFSTVKSVIFSHWTTEQDNNLNLTAVSTFRTLKFYELATRSKRLKIPGSSNQELA